MATPDLLSAARYDQKAVPYLPCRCEAYEIQLRLCHTLGSRLTCFRRLLPATSSSLQVREGRDKENDAGMIRKFSHNPSDIFGYLECGSAKRCLLLCLKEQFLSANTYI